MKRLLVPLFLILLGLGGGIGAGLMLRPAEDHPEAAEDTAPHPPAVPPDYVKLSNQFIVPLIEEERITSMVVLSLSLEVPAGTADTVFAKEPRLRDSFLQILFDHANTGGFRGSFTDGSNLTVLRRTLLEAARAVLHEGVTDVLITDIARQDS